MHLMHIMAACLVIAVSVNAAETKKPVLRQTVAVVPTRITLDAQKESAEVTMTSKSQTIVSLAGTSTTGFSWTVVKAGDPAVVTVGEPVFEKGKTRLAATGLGGTFAVRLTAVSKGTTEVYLEYRRPWEKEVAPTKRMSIKVTVD